MAIYLVTDILSRRAISSFFLAPKKWIICVEPIAILWLKNWEKQLWTDQTKFLKTRKEESKRCFNRQRNFCVSFLRKTKRRFFGKLDYRVVSDNRKIWKIVSPLYSEKAFHKESIILNNNNKTISNDEDLAEIF